MLLGDDWILDHLQECKGPGNSQKGTDWVRRVRREKPNIVFVCDVCNHRETIDLATNLKRARHIVRLAGRQEDRFGKHRCRSCMQKVASENARKTRANPAWKASRAEQPSWQSKAEPSKLAEWVEKGRKTRLATISAKTPDERSVGVQKQWASMTQETKDARAAKIGAWSKQHWANMTPAARAARVQKMVKGLPRSRVSNEFKAALQQAGLYAGFQSEVAVSGFIVDECNTKCKLIIEFHGDYYHCNPRMFTDPNKVNTTLRMTASEKWKYDRRRLACFLALGYRVLIVWESDWKGNPQKVLARVRDFVGSESDDHA